ncbi:MAG: biotin--[acetyl-CoA-carboxylase] ligase [Candidatus Omnitrophica bacterium]|nr:biotin--[acetyl-CoA-carboxylase] ligase [Candidatus Omnitrophota bacterium]HOX54898.1 biotin--[acetyl-CoA-carboxylase] ligase [Candidatus Omnitrophota bacterium]
MKEKILKHIRKASSYISGEELSSVCDISRAGIWKHIQELRQDGYDIEAVPNLGYRLVSSPDKLLPEEIKFGLNTKIVGRHIYHYEVVGSTMDAAFKLAMESHDEGAVVCAESQHAGRGRLGRSWVSPKSKGIYLSVILKPKISPNETPRLTLLTALAVCEAIKKVAALECQIKWPNDILINERKIGGILTEINAETDRTKFVILGLGVNVNTKKSFLPTGATSLKEEKDEAISRIELTREILRQIEHLYLVFQKEGFGAILDKIKHLSSTLNKRVKAVSRGAEIEGEATDIDKDGALLIRKDSGFIEKIYTGDIIKLR